MPTAETSFPKPGAAIGQTCAAAASRRTTNPIIRVRRRKQTKTSRFVFPFASSRGKKLIARNCDVSGRNARAVRLQRLGQSPLAERGRRAHARAIHQAHGLELFLRA